MPRSKTVERIPPRGTFHGYNNTTHQPMTMKGKEWNEFAAKHGIVWRKIEGAPNEVSGYKKHNGVTQSIEVYLDGTTVFDSPKRK